MVTPGYRLAVERVLPDDTSLPDLVRLVTDYVGTWYPDGPPFSDADRDLLAALPEPYTGTQAAWICRLDGSPVGCLLAVLIPQREAVEIRKMYVDPRARGVGAGVALLDASAGFCEQLGARGLTLTVHESRAAARRMYARYGFVVTGRDPDGFLRMDLQLPCGSDCRPCRY